MIGGIAIRVSILGGNGIYSSFFHVLLVMVSVTPRFSDACGVGPYLAVLVCLFMIALFFPVMVSFSRYCLRPYAELRCSVFVSISFSVFSLHGFY